ncbi:MAG: ABC transporter permease, partial [Deltaproteobacteria bacterium]|nr:ABC transporter permease [Deltaproteobacteria bacterium]
IWQEILHTIRQNRLRSLLTAFGVFWGLFMLVIMIGTGHGLQKGAYSEFSGYATNSVFIWPRLSTKPYKGFPIGRRFKFTNEDTEIIRRMVPGVSSLAPRARKRGGDGDNNVTHGDRTATLTIYGDHPEVKNIRLLQMISGRFLNRLDLAERRKVAVIGEETVKLLFEKEESPMGTYVSINNINFKVVGVYRLPSRNDEDYEEEAKAVFLPLSTFQQVFNWGEVVGWFSITSQPQIKVSDVRNEVIRILADRHAIAPEDKRAFGSWNMEDEFQKIADLFMGIKFIVWFVGIFTLIAGIIGVSNIMLIAVKERTREIGIKRTVGATPFSVISQVLMEALLLTSIPGYLALVCAVAVLEGVGRLIYILKIDAQMFQDPSIDFAAALLALAVLTIAGTLAGLIPAYRAVQGKPVEALRYEL